MKKIRVVSRLIRAVPEIFERWQLIREVRQENQAVLEIYELTDYTSGSGKDTSSLRIKILQKYS